MALRKQAEKIMLIVEMMRTGTGDSLPCFVGGEAAMEGLRDRFKLKQDLSEADCRTYINRLIDESLDNWRTRWYDRYQYCCQNIL
jgi:phosphatidylinositol kinase/protein kinase (PI-3  family)